MTDPSLYESQEILDEVKVANVILAHDSLVVCWSVWKYWAYNSLVVCWFVWKYWALDSLIVCWSVYKYWSHDSMIVCWSVYKYGASTIYPAWLMPWTGVIDLVLLATYKVSWLVIRTWTLCLILTPDAMFMGSFICKFIFHQLFV